MYRKLYFFFVRNKLKGIGTIRNNCSRIIVLRVMSYNLDDIVASDIYIIVELMNEVCCFELIGVSRLRINGVSLIKGSYIFGLFNFYVMLCVRKNEPDFFIVEFISVFVAGLEVYTNRIWINWPAVQTRRNLYFYIAVTCS